MSFSIKRVRTCTSGFAVLTLTAGAALLAGPAGTSAASSSTHYSVSVPESCSVSFFGTQTITFTYSGTVPSSVVAGKTFDLTHEVTKLSVPAALSNEAYAQGVRTGEGFISAENLTTVNGTPSSFNVIPHPPYDTGKVPVKQNTPIVLPAPKKGSFSYKHLKATSSGTNFELQVGDFSATFNGYDANGNVIFSNQPITCAAPSPAVTLVSIPVT